MEDENINFNTERVWLHQEECFSNDFDHFLTKIIKESSRLALKTETLGLVNKMPILLLHSTNDSYNKNIMFSGCFHGDEPAGSWGILRFLQNLNSLPKDVNISFLPLVNPTGFINLKRSNYLDQDPNRNFYHIINDEHPSEEGLILLSHFDRIKTLAKDIFVSLHEDWEFDKFYIYSFETSDEPGTFSKALIDAELQFFKPFPDGPLEGAHVKDGLIFRHCDGSFEDFLFHKGTPRTACTETPGKIDLYSRIEANCNIINKVVRYAQLLP